MAGRVAKSRTAAPSTSSAQKPIRTFAELAQESPYYDIIIVDTPWMPAITNQVEPLLSYINDPAKTGAGASTSVMDYIPANIMPKGRVQGDYYTPRLGPYDHWAIEYGYKPIGAGNPQGELAELEKIARVIKKLDASAPHAVLLVLDATTGQNAHAQVETFKSLSPVDALVLTKLDGSAKGGVLVALAEKFKLPVVAIGAPTQA